MKKIILLLSVVILSMIALNSCSKYEEGPAFSLRTKMSRITGTWVIDEITENGVNVKVPYYIRMEVIFNKSGTGGFEIIVTAQDYDNPLLYREDFQWQFEVDKEYISITGETTSDERSLKGPAPPDPDDEEEEYELIVDKEEVKKLFNINLYAKILRLTNTELWLIETKYIDEEPLVIRTKMSKKL